MESKVKKFITKHFINCSFLVVVLVAIVVGVILIIRIQNPDQDNVVLSVVNILCSVGLGVSISNWVRWYW